jgi:putative SOS response-associated peptidase YedK
MTTAVQSRMDNTTALIAGRLDELIAPIHPEAIRTIQRDAAWDSWLRGSYDDVVALQRPYPAELMSVRGPVFPTRVKQEP